MCCLAAYFQCCNALLKALNVFANLQGNKRCSFKVKMPFTSSVLLILLEPTLKKVTFKYFVHSL